MDNNLSAFYNDLKSELAVKKPDLINVSTPGSNFYMSPGASRWRNLAVKETDKLKNDCYKHILVDMYCKILPLDQDYIDTHQGQMSSDIDNMLASKNMTPAQYLTSAKEKTNSPLLEFIIRSGNSIGKEFMKEADETLKDAQKNKIDLPPPEADIENDNVQNAIVDIKDDSEYRTFVDKLREKTINRIVNDVSKIITDKKEEDDLTFKSESTSNEIKEKDDKNKLSKNEKDKHNESKKTKNNNLNKSVDKESRNKDIKSIKESTVGFLVDYANEKLWKENIEINSDNLEKIIGISIRESTLNIIDSTFKQPESDFKSFSSKIRFNKGILMNESTLVDLFPELHKSK